ncbi:MAG: tetratricopeptide repeat protein [Planctomycetes bacterium]|nr:tetratricopeptide repeat protein [Planctomycetota bacterium]
MRSMRAWHSFVAAGLLLGACSTKAETTPANPPAQAPAAGEAPATAPATAPSTGNQEPVQLNYKDEQKAKALAGIVYSSGRAVIDPIAAATKVTVQDPVLAETMHAQGRAQLSENHTLEAIDSFTRSVLLQPENPAHYSGLADALLVKRMAKEAVAALRVAVELAPESAAYRFQLGDALVRVNQREEAIGELQKSLALDASNVTAHERLAVQHFYLNDFASAWKEVHAVEALGGAVPPQFRVMLAEAAVEPSAK